MHVRHEVSLEFGVTARHAPDRRPSHRLTTVVRSFADRLLHPWRRRIARARLAKRPRPRSVAFVCKANLQRSPFAAACLRAAIPPDSSLELRVTSAGFIRPDRTPPAAAQQCARKYGVDLETHRSRLVAALAVPQWDLFVVMDRPYAEALRRRYQLGADRILILGDLDPEPIRERAIADPDGEPPDVLEACYSRIARCTHALAALITAPE